MATQHYSLYLFDNSYFVTFVTKKSLADFREPFKAHLLDKSKKLKRFSIKIFLPKQSISTPEITPDLTDLTKVKLFTNQACPFSSKQ